uniref:Uncharacterized protein n=1 Tax=viral metagenome TaxID=1070528 RepID=A0A6M3KZC5_9ZZZZ
MRVEWDATLYEYTLRYRYISGLDAWIRARAYETVRDGYWLTKRAKEELAELLTGAT